MKRYVYSRPGRPQDCEAGKKGSKRPVAFIPGNTYDFTTAEYDSLPSAVTNHLHPVHVHVIKPKSESETEPPKPEPPKSESSDVKVKTKKGKGKGKGGDKSDVPSESQERQDGQAERSE